MEKYLFNNAVDMINLAKKVQAKVYWESYFSIDGGEEKYKYFWDYAEDAMMREYDGVTIDDNDNVVFIRSME